MDAFEILVIVLSTILALCLILATVALVMFIIILRHVKRVVESATKVVDNVESVSEFFKSTSMTTAAVKIISNAVDVFKKRK